LSFFFENFNDYKGGKNDKMNNKSKWKVISSEVVGEFDTEEQADEFECLCENHEEAHNIGQNPRSFEVVECVK
jgi:hypothetical protein